MAPLKFEPSSAALRRFALVRLVQAKLLQSFENYDIAHAPLRADNLSEGGLRLLIDIRQFDINGAPAPRASISLSAKLVDGSGRLKAARVFEQSAPIDNLRPANAAAQGHVRSFRRQRLYNAAPSTAGGPFYY